MPSRDPAERPVIGWREFVSLPLFGIETIKAKVDTGARTSSLHAFDIREFKKGKHTLVRFKVHPEQRSNKHEVEIVAPLRDRRQVRDSGGRTERRPVVSATLELLDQRFEIELTLTARDVMGFRMLLGRQAVRGRFVVDPARSFCNGKRLRGTRRLAKERRRSR